ncbi:hypothetical protein QKT07_gp3 [Hymenopteran rhabdo-related virus]|uniref:Uncharacterized protein n=1 Tax=Hymenopteran rhabdo-related virus 46 TaxID=2847807 RepID=A0AAE9GZP5_9RHAB|nr:hypothetical protein QKT07_gp3 [Hymenopteran rhabdo-related virus]UOS86049.1 hypothetical protein [Hymenopteran rhabdo-related virus 46]
MMKVKQLWKSKESPSPSAPIPDKTSTFYILVLSGSLLFDFEGPLPGSMISLIMKRLAAMITAMIIPSSLQRDLAGAFLMQYLYTLGKGSMPKVVTQNRELVPRATFAIPLRGYTSSSCLSQPIDMITVPLEMTWEFPGIEPYPIIVSVSGAISIKTDLISRRDVYRNIGFESIVYPKPKWVKRAKTIHMSLGQGTPPLESVLTAWPISRVRRTSLIPHNQ